jgi:signal transduction histidine kinase
MAASPSTTAALHFGHAPTSDPGLTAPRIWSPELALGFVRLRALVWSVQGNLRVQLVTLGAACAVLTVVGALVPSLHFGYRERDAHVALEAAAALIALLAAFLVFGRLQRSARLDDLLLACGLGVVALANFGFRAVPAVAGAGDSRFVLWSAVGGRLLGAALLAAAAFAPRRVPKRHSRTLYWAVALSVAFVAAAATGALLAEPHLPSAASAAYPSLDAHPVLLATQLFAALFYAAAAVGFAQRAEARKDALMHWLALACVVSVFSRINYFLFPSADTDGVYLGDGFRVAFFFLLLIGALQEISSYWKTAARAAVLEERRRIARDLHDGLAQELLFIAGKAREITAVAGPRRGPADEMLASAAERALHESRRAIAVLTRPLDEPLDIVLAQAAEDVAERAGLEVCSQLAKGVHLDPATSEALARIVREAVTNAARHGRASVVVVELENDNGLVLRVADDGDGFEPERSVRPGAYGMVSMRERAQALGGRLRVESAPGRGTTISVELPG